LLPVVDLLFPLVLFAQNLVTDLGYPGVFLVAFLENFFPPLPSELIFPFVGFVAGTGRLDLLLVVISGTLGALAGALFWYALGYLLGRANLKVLIERYGRPLRISFSGVERAERWFERYERPAVFFGRLVPLVRTFISVPAGFVRMPLPWFLLYSFAGTFFWTGALSGGGYLLGERWEKIVPFVQNYELISGVLIAAVLVFALAWILKSSAPSRREG